MNTRKLIIAALFLLNVYVMAQQINLNPGAAPGLQLYNSKARNYPFCEIFAFMGKPPDERLTNDVAREICQRQGIKAMLTGTIASLGNHYVVTLTAANGSTGDSLASEQVEVESKEQVLKSLDKAASDLRQKMGESLA